MSSINTRAGIAVARARSKAEMTQLELAQELEISRTSMSNIERGKQAMSLEMFCRIADQLHLRPDDLLKTAIQIRYEPPHDTLKKQGVEDWILEILNKQFPDSNETFKVRGQND